MSKNPNVALRGQWLDSNLENYRLYLDTCFVKFSCKNVVRIKLGTMRSFWGSGLPVVLYVCICMYNNPTEEDSGMLHELGKLDYKLRNHWNVFHEINEKIDLIFG